MSDDVREPRTFEPPPWERDQFDELRKQRDVERTRLDEELASARQQEARAHDTPAAPVTPAAASTAPTVSDPARARAAGAAPGPDTRVSDEEMAEMLAGLAAQEPSTAESLWKAGTIAAAIVIGVGAITALVGLVLAVSQGAAKGMVGTMVGAATAAFGIVLAAVGGWVLYTALKKRGA